MSNQTGALETIAAKSGRNIRRVTTFSSDASRREFERLNGTTSTRSSRKGSAKSDAVGGGGDSDVVDVIFPGHSNLVVVDGGGRRMYAAKVQLVFWGDEWLSTPPPSPSIEEVLADIEGIVASPYLDAVRQYGVVPFQGTFASLGDVYIEHRSVPNYEFTTVDVNYEAWLLMTSGPIDDSSTTIVCLIMPPGATPNESRSGEHDRSLQPNLRWVPTIWIKFSSREQMSRTFSHELVETITDPEGDGIQVEPTGYFDWHEVGDVCKGLVGQLGGVNVQSYWSAKDNACVIPTLVAVEAWQIMCVHKRGDRNSPRENIDKVGGVHLPSGRKYWMLQTEVITRIESGNKFIVKGIDGSIANVVVRIHFPDWAPEGSKFITTIADDSKEDNLLALPDCGQLDHCNP